MNTRLKHDFSESPRLLIVGASTRAAAASAVRAGYRPLCVDQYGDRDLQTFAEIIPRTAQPAEWLSALHARGPLEWIYTGGLENQWELISQINTRHTLRGCGPDCLSRVRDPFHLEALLSNHPIRMAPCLAADAVPADSGNWLCKPLRSAAGQGIRFLETAPDSMLDRELCYLQRYQPGQPMSALYLSFPEGAELVGLSLQFAGTPALGAEEFQFCGGATISPVPGRFRSDLEDLGTTVSASCGLQGLFGCDLIWNPAQPTRFWLTEVNPRYTSLTELFELQYRVPLLAWHLGACRAFAGETDPSSRPEEFERSLTQAGTSPEQICKGILYSREDRLAPEVALPAIEVDCFKIPESADIPYSGTPIPARTPFCSRYGRGRDLRESLECLVGRIEDYQRRLASESTLSDSVSEALISPVPVRELENHFF
jgi:predicted ATP-grasp superfamily ATP-dependent carboligase